MPKTDNEIYRMNSTFGKQILALVRGGDYAHPGEEEAVRLAFDGVDPGLAREVLDVGCGLGGTADCIARLGFGRVTGLDIDPDTVDYASKRYPEQRFICASACEMSSVLCSDYAIICMFNSFYTLPDQRGALCECAKVAAPGGRLFLFDYSMHQNSEAGQRYIRGYQGSRFSPVILESIEETLNSCGWKMNSQTDLSSHYARWYEAFTAQIVAKEADILRTADSSWYQQTLQKFMDLFQAVREGAIGGTLIKAVRE